MTATYDLPQDLSELDANREPEVAMPRPPRKPRRKTPQLHVDPHMGPLVLNEALNTLEALQRELKGMPAGRERRALESREWVQRLWTEELEAFHGDDGVEL
jgi:hypothetical protein